MEVNGQFQSPALYTRCQLNRRQSELHSWSACFAMNQMWFLGHAISSLVTVQLSTYHWNSRGNNFSLFHIKVWVNAAAQNFNSLGIAFGSVMSFASYNRFSNQILVDTLAVSTINGFTSILVGVFAFATIGNIAVEQGTPIEDVVSDGE